MVHVRVCKGPFDANVCDELHQIPGNDLANEAIIAKINHIHKKRLSATNSWWQVTNNIVYSSYTYLH